MHPVGLPAIAWMPPYVAHVPAATTAQARGASRSIHQFSVSGSPVAGSLPNDVQYPSPLIFSLGIEPSTTTTNGSTSPRTAARNGARKSSPPCDGDSTLLCRFTFGSPGMSPLTTSSIDGCADAVIDTVSPSQLMPSEIHRMWISSNPSLMAYLLGRESRVGPRSGGRCRGDAAGGGRAAQSRAGPPAGSPTGASTVIDSRTTSSRPVLSTSTDPQAGHAASAAAEFTGVRARQRPQRTASGSRTRSSAASSAAVPAAATRTPCSITSGSTGWPPMRTRMPRTGRPSARRRAASTIPSHIPSSCMRPLPARVRPAGAGLVAARSIAARVFAFRVLAVRLFSVRLVARQVRHQPDGVVQHRAHGLRQLHPLLDDGRAAADHEDASDLPAEPPQRPQHGDRVHAVPVDRGRAERVGRVQAGHRLVHGGAVHLDDGEGAG